MAVKKGYKQTEVGVIPEDWKCEKIQSIPPKGMRYGIVDGPFGSNLKTIHYRTSGIPIITSGYVTDGRFRADSYFYVDKSKFLEEKRSEVTPGDIVMAKIGERCGASAILPISHEVGILSGNALKISVDKQRFSSNYIWCVLWSHHTSGKLEELRTTGAQPALSIASLKKYVLPVPSTLHEQEAIAGALSDADAWIESLEQLIAKKRLIKQGAMQELLTGKRRLPGFSGEWEKKRVIELGEVVTGGTPRTDVAEYWGDKYPWITPTDISTHKDMYSSERSLTQKGFYAVRSLPPNSVLVTCIASIGKNAVLRVHGSCNQQINAVIPNETSDPDFLYYLFEASKQYLLANAGTTATSIISKAAFSELTFRVPPLAEQTAIASVLSDMDAEIAALETKLTKARQIKQGMMQELLTGRIRLIEN